MENLVLCRFEKVGTAFITAARIAAFARIATFARIASGLVV